MIAVGTFSAGPATPPEVVLREGACRRPGVDPETFWPEDKGGGGLALHICRSHCPVWSECFAWAQKVHDDGYRWPGCVVGGVRWVLHHGGSRTHRATTNYQPSSHGCPICKEES